MNDNAGAKAPVHLWIVGVVSLLWNCIGAYDYTMTKLGNVAYLEQAGMGSEEMAWLDTMPLWASAAWALGVWGAVAGSVLLLLRSRYAVHAFALSILGIAVTTVFQYGFPHPPALSSTIATVFSVVLWVIAIALYLYASRQAKAGVLR